MKKIGLIKLAIGFLVLGFCFTPQIVYAQAFSGSWSPVISGTSRQLNDVSFVSSAVGYACGRYGTLLKTTDYGNTWAQAPFSDPSDVNNHKNNSDHFVAVQAVDATTIYALTNHGGLYKTDPATGGFYRILNINAHNCTDFSFYSVSEGWVTGDRSTNNAMVWKITDGGATATRISLGDNDFLEGIFFLDSLHGWVGGYKEDTGTFTRYIYRTVDGGLNWTAVESAGLTSQYKINDIFFIDSSYGWAVGDDGLLMKSTNGGLNWTVITSANLPLCGFNRVHFIDRNVGWITGQNNLIMISYNGGDNWLPQTQQFPNENLYGLDILTNGFVFGCAVGSLGRILIYDHPVIQSIQPASGQQGTSIDLTIYGSGFQEGMAVQITGAGIGASAPQFISSTEVIVSVNIDPAAPTGPRTITLINPDQSQASGNFEVTPAGVLNYPTISKITPDYIFVGEVKLITIEGTNLQNGAIVVFSDEGLNVQSTSYISSNQIVVSLEARSSAIEGTSGITIVNPAPDYTATSEPDAISIIKPKIISISPFSINQGTTTTIVITGIGLIPGFTLNLGSGVTVNSITVDSSNEAHASVTIAADAPTGGHDAIITMPSGYSFSKDNAINVQANIPGITNPVISTVSPNTITQGTSTTIMVNGTNFQNGAALAFSGVGLGVNSVTFISQTSLEASITALSDSQIGPRNLIIVNPDQGSGVLNNAVTVLAKIPLNNPALSKCVPNSGRPGETLNLTLNGSNFPYPVDGVTVGIDFNDPGITVSNVRVISPTQITFTATLSQTDTTVGPHKITVTVRDPAGNETGAAILENGFTVLDRTGNFAEVISKNPWYPQRDGDLTLQIRVLESGNYRVVIFNPDYTMLNAGVYFNAGQNKFVVSRASNNWSNGIYKVIVVKDNKIVGNWKFAVVNN